MSSPWSEHTFECGHTKFVHEDWDLKDYCSKECFFEHEFEEVELECGHSIPLRKDRDGEPKYCKECKEEYPPETFKCEACESEFVWGTMAQINAQKRGWDKPNLCHDCRNFIKGASAEEVECNICHGSIPWSPYQQLMEQHKGWTRPTKCSRCKDFLKNTNAVTIVCEFCHGSIEWDAFCQLMETYQGWIRPVMCPDCKQNQRLLIAGATSRFRGKRTKTEIKWLLGEGPVAITYEVSNPMFPKELCRTRLEREKAVTRDTASGNTERTYLERRHLEGQMAVTYNANNEEQIKTNIERRWGEGAVAVSRFTHPEQSKKEGHIKQRPSRRGRPPAQQEEK